MKIDTLANYTGYVKGKMIRFNGLSEDSHLANEIYKEIDKGVYL